MGVTFSLHRHVIESNLGMGICKDLDKRVKKEGNQMTIEITI